MFNNHEIVDVEDALASLKLILFTLMKGGMSEEDLKAEITSLLKKISCSETMPGSSTDTSDKVKDQDTIEYGNLIFNKLRRLIRYKGKMVKLTPQNTLLLDLFIKKAGEVVSHEEIIEHIYGEIGSINVDDFTFVLVHRLRKKLQSVSDNEDWILTYQEGGYKIIDKEEI